MKKRLIIGLLIIVVLSSGIISGCTIGPVTAKTIYDRYMAIVEDYTVTVDENIVPESSLFNANGNLVITYKDSNLKNEIVSRINDVVDPADAIFHIFADYYPNMVYSAFQFFNQYKSSLLNTNNNWDSAKLERIYNALLSFEEAIHTFQIEKTALENLPITFNPSNLTSPYPYTTMVQYNQFKDAYNNFIQATILFNKLFEESYVEDVLQIDSFLTVSEVPYYELTRITYSASIYLSEAVYYYYVTHLDGFDADGADLGLYQDMIATLGAIDLTQSINSSLVTDLITTDYYRLVHSQESQVVAQANVYTVAVQNELKLKDSTKESDIQLKEDYGIVIEQAMQNYRNYASFVVELIHQITSD